SLEEVLFYFSQQTGVPLSLDPKLKNNRLRSLRVTETLREAIKGLGGPEFEWIPDGKGYRLVPKEGT
ncbi:MAG: hypothetical protein M3347_14485, partial [Armatimonadota bacterium]|nr:hypothetical protein [Armatimonadota bacterium]